MRDTARHFSHRAGGSQRRASLRPPCCTRRQYHAISHRARSPWRTAWAGAKSATGRVVHSLHSRPSSPAGGVSSCPDTEEPSPGGNAPPRRRARVQGTARARTLSRAGRARRPGRLGSANGHVPRTGLCPRVSHTSLSVGSPTTRRWHVARMLTAARAGAGRCVAARNPACMSPSRSAMLRTKVCTPRRCTWQASSSPRSHRCRSFAAIGRC